ncbi:lip and palate transmembrane 1 homolog [Octopus vulgaris]|uniref:Lip and palate transmembrane 1 homolog n=2 Tax=Octopus TaxID=6643 RepID=A0AA36BJG3_OCTVU|nr:cleft lip and palate transmembrane protein 1 homolog [Octopus sinensis]XP_036367618.1 cleft lip and palate transmembrane protein 1 homolog [Octopus sinensis]CAI9734582.1 lip and palate transmembrane 1 homolog [Octopus vulgaris]
MSSNIMSAESTEQRLDNDETALTSTEDHENKVEPANQNVEQTEEQQQPQQQRNRFNMWGIAKTFFIRMIFIYLVSSYFRRSPTPATDSRTVQEPSSNVFPKGFLMDMYVYVSEQEVFTDFDNPESEFWVQKGLVYGDWASGIYKDGSYDNGKQLTLSDAVLSNGSIYIHVYFTKSGYPPNSKDEYAQSMRAYSSRKLNKYKKRKFHETVNLLTGETEAHPNLRKKENSSSFEIISHWHPNLTINLLDDDFPWVKGQVPPPLDEYVVFQLGSNKYFPVIFFNDYWNLNSDYVPINYSTKVVNLTLTYKPISLFRWQLYAAQNMRNKWYNVLGSNFVEEGEEEQDSVKIAFLETNPYLLAITVIVSIVHSVFEFLAFKNDIQFWKSRKSLEGLSVRSVFFNVFQSVVVVLYVLDNETNPIVKISVIIGLAIEIWKIQKVLDISLDRENKILGFIPRPIFKEKSTYKSATKQYDLVAFKYLSWCLFPLLVMYSIYSLVYNEHKGWYSFSLSMLYGFLLTFGFIMMTPQLFINYKMKSVAHLPWRMLTYKALNTFIDDIFAFVIKMPTLYRLGCFRDDIVFFIYLYQRYIYRVDPQRLNEFGTSQEMLEPNGTVALRDGETDSTSPDEGAEDSALKSDKEKKND